MTSLRIEIGGVLVCNGDVESVECNIHDGRIDLNAVIGESYPGAPDGIEDV